MTYQVQVKHDCVLRGEDGRGGYHRGTWVVVYETKDSIVARGVMKGYPVDTGERIRMVTITKTVYAPRESA